MLLWWEFTGFFLAPGVPVKSAFRHVGAIVQRESPMKRVIAAIVVFGLLVAVAAYLLVHS